MRSENYELFPNLIKSNINHTGKRRTNVRGRATKLPTDSTLVYIPVAFYRMFQHQRTQLGIAKCMEVFSLAAQ